MSESTRTALLEQLDGNRSYIESAYAALDAGEDLEDGDDPQSALDEFGLSVEVKRVVEVVITAGGPAVWIDVEFDADNDPNSATWHGVWGSDRIERNLDLSEPLARWAVSEAEVALY